MYFEKTRKIVTKSCGCVTETESLEEGVPMTLKSVKVLRDEKCGQCHEHFVREAIAAGVLKDDDAEDNATGQSSAEMWLAGAIEKDRELRGEFFSTADEESAQHPSRTSHTLSYDAQV
jgi:hypothetical protein